MFVFAFILSVFSEALSGCVGCMILSLAMLMALALPVLVVAQILVWRKENRLAAERAASHKAYMERFRAAEEAERAERLMHAGMGIPAFLKDDREARYHGSDALGR